jgi:hypothetical protein
MLLVSVSTFFAYIDHGKTFQVFILLKILTYISFAFFLWDDLKKHSVPRGTILPKNTQKCSTWNNLKKIILLSALFQITLSCIQSIKQESSGLYFIFEPTLSPNINGVATVVIKNTEFLRSYGTFLHPNILGMYLVLSYGLYLLIDKYVPRGTILPKNTQKCSTWNNFYQKRTTVLSKMFHVEQFLSKTHNCTLKNVPRGTISRFLVDVIYFMGVLLTFSKTAIFIFIIFYWTFKRKKNCSTWNILGIFTPIILMWGLALLNKEFFISQSILERKIQYLSILKIPSLDVLSGLGIGGYVFSLKERGIFLESWTWQPVHNLWVMMILELGLLPALFLIFLLVKKIISLWKGLSKEERKMNRSLWIGFFIFSCADHYFWDIEQAMVWGILFTVFSFAFSRESLSKKEK